MSWKKDKDEQDVWIDSSYGRGIRIYGDEILVWDEKLSGGDAIDLHIRDDYPNLKKEVQRLIKMPYSEWKKLFDFGGVF